MYSDVFRDWFLLMISTNGRGSTTSTKKIEWFGESECFPLRFQQHVSSNLGQVQTKHLSVTFAKFPELAIFWLPFGYHMKFSTQSSTTQRSFRRRRRRSAAFSKEKLRGSIFFKEHF